MKKHVQYSKIITTAFSVVMLPLSAYVVWKCLDIAEYAVQTGFMGALPYVTAIVGFVEATIAVVFGQYHSNSKTEKKVMASRTVQTVEETEEIEETHTAVNLNIDA